jgi:hypothetical protein
MSICNVSRVLLVPAIFVLKDLAGQHHLHEVFVVNVSGGVLLAMDQLFGFLFSHLLAQRGQHVAQLGAGDVSVTVLKQTNMFLVNLGL